MITAVNWDLQAVVPSSYLFSLAVVVVVVVACSSLIYDLSLVEYFLNCVVFL